MQITTFKDSKTNFMLFTELNSTMTETEKESKWWKLDTNSKNDINILTKNMDMFRPFSCNKVSLTPIFCFVFWSKFKA